jgi:hypothetical protein
VARVNIVGTHDGNRWNASGWVFSSPAVINMPVPRSETKPPLSTVAQSHLLVLFRSLKREI